MSYIKYAEINGNNTEYCNYPPNHITEFKFMNKACPFEGAEKPDYQKPEIKPSPIPNGGLYTNIPQEKQPWHSVPVVPDMTYMISENLKSANPPNGATSQYIGTERPGNNSVTMPNVYKYKPELYNFNLLQ